MQGLSVLTLTATNEDAKQWREDIAVQIVASMRVAIAAVEVSFFIDQDFQSAFLHIFACD